MEKCAVGDLVPNAFNPNELTKGQFQSLVLELRKAGTNHKPIRYRMTNGAREIIDGEQTWRAAIEAGLLEVQIEREDADEYEARRLCVRANHGGKTNPLKLARLIDDMRRFDKKKSNCDIAADLGVSEGTIRNRLLYLDLAERAKKDKTLPTEAQIAALSVRQVRDHLGVDRDEGEGEGAPPPAGPMDKAKKIVTKMTPEEREALSAWMAELP